MGFCHTITPDYGLLSYNNSFIPTYTIIINSDLSSNEMKKYTKDKSDFYTKITKLTFSPPQKEQNHEFEVEMGKIYREKDRFDTKLTYFRYSDGEFKVVGDRVVLVSERYKACPDNPRLGSEFECAGMVDVIYSHDKIIIGVLWDNGRRNVYSYNELALLKDQKVGNDPNRLFLYKKRREGYKR